MNSEVNIKNWIRYYTVFLVILGISAACIGYFVPEMMFMNVKSDFADLTTITGMFGARNLSFGILAILALMSKDPKFYFVLFAGRLVTELQDLLIITTTDAMPVPAVVIVISWLVFFIVPEILALRELKKFSWKS